MDAPSPPRATVLAVDDARDNRLLLRMMLERAGYRALVVDSGGEALRVLEDEQPAVIVLDYMMPEMDGAEVARRVRATPKTCEVPIIMLTASHEEHHIEEAFAAGANDYLTKPVDRRIFIARIEAAIKAVEDSRKAKAADEVAEEWNAIRTDLGEAARVQQARLPPLPARFDGWAIAGALVPGRHVGGDLLDLMPGLGVDRVVALIDVSGHGLAAALVAAAVSSQLRTLVAAHPLPEAMRLLNLDLCREGSGKYACVAVAGLRRDGVEIVNAGLPPVAVLRDGECVAEVEGAGVPPGMIETSEYQSQRCALGPGDRLVLMSDGLTEPFGAPDRILPALDGLGLRDPALRIDELQPSDLAERIRRLGRARIQDPDDATLIVAGRSTSDAGTRQGAER
jgi:phosphoserine phosphatase RsbU/P